VAIETFTIDIPGAVLADLRERIHRTRWPEPAPGAGWSQGTDLEYLQGLLEYWGDEFDWRTAEAELNRYPQFLVTVDDAPVHIVHARAGGGTGVPIVLTHGWPSTFAEYLPLIPLLTDPAAHGLDGPAFDVVLPSLPGYGFTRRPRRAGVTSRHTAGLWHRVMRELGYPRFAAGGGDFGASVSTFMALDDPAPMLGLHLSNLDLPPYLGPDVAPLTDAEQRYVADNDRWASVERGYSAIQSTKPQTVGYGLNDSPAGLAAWLLEKWRSWTDSHGDLDGRFGRDFLLTTLTIYWATQTITPSMRDYFDNRRAGIALGPTDRVRVPTAVAVYPNEFVSEGEPPREWAERIYDVRRWTIMPAGGHFAPVEEPTLLAQDILTFFAELAAAA
jgi:pimeloyl-ACP methyl ester carboxylesterase